MLGKNHSLYILFVVGLALALASGAAAQTKVEVYGSDAEVLVDFGTHPTNQLPVLFVHGHNFQKDMDDDYNYKKNWVDPLCNLPSFAQALDRNPHLAIEPYYLRFETQNRPIAEDAAEIARAVDLILHRHDPDYILSNPRRSTHAQVAIIAMSKGTISSRLYLKQLSDYAALGCDGSRDLPCVGPGFYPVSELIAIAPPNHGLNTLVTGKSEALRELNNGYGPLCFPLGSGTNFIQNLNGHSICDTFGKSGCTLCPCQTMHTEPEAIYPSEAPLSRAPDAPLRDGVLYLTLFAANGADELTGGHALSDDCQGRRLALNLSPDAVNIPLAKEEVGFCLSTTHSLTPHWPKTICRALYTATHHRASLETPYCPLDAEKVPQIPAPPAIDTMLALDLSGSMDWPACPDCGPKVEPLREAVELFVKLWQVLARPQDQIGAVTFRSEASRFSSGGEVLGPVGTHGQAIIDHLASETPGGSTAMGGALHLAIQTLSNEPSNAGDKRHVILFTDGMQNRNPMVIETDGGGLVIKDQLGRRPPTTDFAPLDLEKLDGIAIHTLGIGTGGPYNELLQKIAETTGGRFQSNLDTKPLKEFFIQKVIDVMRGFSPQLVAYLRGSTQDKKTVVEKVAIDEGAHRVIFVVSFPRGSELDLHVWKDAQEVTAQAQIIYSPFYRILTFDLPFQVGGESIESGGEWQLLLSSAASSPALPYEIAAITDGVELYHEVSLDPPPHVAGRPLELTVRLRAGEEPLTGATVTARILRSETAVGTLLATTPMPRETTVELETEATVGQKKLQALLQQEKIWAQLEPLEVLGSRVDLRDNGDGTYSGSYDHTSIPGTYNVTFHIRGDDERVGGEFRRSETRSAQVELGQIRPVDLGAKARLVDGQLELTLRPRDIFGNYLGPDYDDRIRLVLESGRAARVVGRADGSYALTLPIPTGEDPELELELLGRSIFKDEVSEVLRRFQPSSWVLSAHLGYTLPTGTFDRFFDSDLSAELDLEYALTPRWALRGVLGRYTFDPDFDVDGATLYVRYYRPWRSPTGAPGSTRLFAEIGPGIYDPDGTGSTAGLSFGLGVCKPLSQRLEGELGADYFHLFDSGDDIRFVAVKAGLRYSF